MAQPRLADTSATERDVATALSRRGASCADRPARDMLLDDRRSSDVSSSIGARQHHKLPDRHSISRRRRLGRPPWTDPSADWACTVGPDRSDGLYRRRVLDDAPATCLLYHLGRSGQRSAAELAAVAAIGLGTSGHTAECAAACCHYARVTQLTTHLAQWRGLGRLCLPRPLPLGRRCVRPVTLPARAAWQTAMISLLYWMAYSCALMLPSVLE